MASVISTSTKPAAAALTRNAASGREVQLNIWIGITVNGEVVNIASFLVKAGDTVGVREKAKKQPRITDAVKLAEGQGMPNWVTVDATKLEGIFKKTPDRDEFGADIKEALIVELYSR